MIHRGIATVALALGVCFLLLSHFDPQFFLIHFYESLMYLAIVLMLFYFEDRWAYMMGVVAPAARIVLMLVWSGTSGFARNIAVAFNPSSPFFPTGLLTTLATVLSIGLIGTCVYRWRREFTGLHKGWSTLLVSMVVVAGYYAVLVLWILRWPPVAA